MDALKEALRLIAMRPGGGHWSWSGVKDDRMLEVSGEEDGGSLYICRTFLGDPRKPWDTLPSDTPEQVRAALRWLDTGDEP